MKDLALEVKSLSKEFQDFKLDNVSFELEKGMVMGLVGENGAGKTTIIKLILNAIEKSGGEINIFGMDNTKEEIA